ncbi:IS110 family transposase [Modicisalibacter xianhensis]
MTASPQLMPDTVCVAIDIAKRYHDVLVRWPNGREKALKIPNTRIGHDDLIRFLKQQKAPVLAVLESTADFHRPLAYRLAQAGIPVHLASSLAGARVREALYTSWDKHDRKDARVLMYLLTQGMTHPSSVRGTSTSRRSRIPISRSLGPEHAAITAWLTTIWRCTFPRWNATSARPGPTGSVISC